MLAIAIAFSSTAFAQSLNGIVIDVSDGDTATIITTEDEHFEIRFYGVDTPETKNTYLGWEAQPFSSEAKEFTKNMIDGKEVFVRLKGDVTYGRRWRIFRRWPVRLKRTRA